MITIEVIAYYGQPVPQPLSADFDEMGGSIGRGAGSTLVLPDPNRNISRSHAMVVFRAGGYVIRDVGSTVPVIVNGSTLGNGREAPIADGDEVHIGGYTLHVTSRRANLPAAASPTAVTTEPVKDDPLAAFGARPSAANPFADLIGPAATPAPPVGSPKAPAAPPKASPLDRVDDRFGAPPASHGGPAEIPADYDPFEDVSPPSGRASAILPDDLDLGLGPASGNKGIDELFGLDANASRDPLAPGNPLAAPIAGPSSALSSDPLEALRGQRPVNPDVQSVQRNDTPELYGAFVPPEAKPDLPSSAKAGQAPRQQQSVDTNFAAGGPQPSAPATRRPPAGDMMVSWDSADANSQGEIKTIIVPTPRPKPPAAGTGPAEPPPTVASNAPPQAAPARASGSPVVVAAPPDALLQAFLDGAGVPELHFAGKLTPEVMNIFGKLLRESIQGTLDLLLARAVTKRQMRAEVTMIAARENNPLKFSPTVEVAMTHLLAPQGRGFMSPLRAIKDAYNDLRSHEFGLMAGMRAALSGVLARFGPEQLEQRLTQKTVVDAVLPINRKAKLWDLFRERYVDISKEAEDDFHALFGKEFMRAYEDQIAKLERDDPSLKH